MLALGVNAGIYDANAGIVHWINPNAFVGIFLVIIFLWVSCCMVGALHSIQTPRVMLTEPLDWGKVEKTEE